MGQTTRIRDQVIHQPPMRQEVGLVKRTPFKMDTIPRVQEQPRQPQQGGWRK